MSNEVKHTPGEWKWDFDHNSHSHGSGFRIWKHEGGYRGVAVTDRATDEDEANARLIASAPCLLPKERDEIVAALTAAITKATSGGK